MATGPLTAGAAPGLWQQRDSQLAHRLMRAPPELPERVIQEDA